MQQHRSITFNVENWFRVDRSRFLNDSLLSELLFNEDGIKTMENIEIIFHKYYVVLIIAIKIRDSSRKSHMNDIYHFISSYIEIETMYIYI